MWQLLFVMLHHFTFCLAFLSQGVGGKGAFGLYAERLQGNLKIFWKR